MASQGISAAPAPAGAHHANGGMMQTPKSEKAPQKETGEKDLKDSDSAKNKETPPVAGTRSSNPVGNPNDLGQAGDYSR